jgi:hypothetical protein
MSGCLSLYRKERWQQSRTAQAAEKDDENRSDGELPNDVEQRRLPERTGVLFARLEINLKK